MCGGLLSSVDCTWDLRPWKSYYIVNRELGVCLQRGHYPMFVQWLTVPAVNS